MSNSKWDWKDNKTLFISGGIALSSLLLSASMWLFRKYRKVTLNSWLDEYINDVKEDLKESNKEKIPLSTIASIMNLINEIQSFLFLKYHSDLEEDRKNSMDNEKLYEQLISETVELGEQYYQEASNILENRLGVNMEGLRMQMSNEDPKEIKEAMNKKRDYDDKELPEISPDKLKEAYVQYAKTYSTHSRIAAEQMAIMNQRPDYQEIGMRTIFTNKYMLNDTIKRKYNVETKYLSQLLRKHGLLNDPEISYYYDEVNRVHSPIN